MRARPARWTRPSRSCSTSTGWRRATASSRSARPRSRRTTTCSPSPRIPVGRRQYTLRVKNLATGELLPDRIENVEPHIAWTADSRSILYLEKDPETLLARRVRRHVLGTDPAQDALVYEQDDESFYTSVGTTKDEHYITIFARSTVSTEVRYADAADPALAFRVFLPRERDLEYYPDHLDGRWIIRTNWQAPNYRLMEATVGEEGDRANWRELLAHREDAFVDGFDLFSDFLAIEERSDAMRKIRIRPWGGGKDFYIGSDEPAYTTSLGVNAEIDTRIVRYEYTSLTTPMTVYDYDIQTGERQLMKRTPVLGGFDSANYRTELVWAPARDGAKVPVSLVYRAGVPQGRQRAAAAVRLRLLRRDHGPGVLDRARVAARPRLRLRARAHPRRPGDGPALVRERQAAPQEEHLHRLHRRHALPRPGGLRRRASASRRWAAARAGC